VSNAHWPTPETENNAMSIGTILLIILVLVLVGALPRWGHSRSWGYLPSGGVGMLLVVVVVLVLLGYF
jgi:hypothetical protein